VALHSLEASVPDRDRTRAESCGMCGDGLPDAGNLVGILSRRDVLRSFQPSGSNVGVG